MEYNDSELLGVLDAAVAKGVHQETVRRAIRAGRLPALRIGRNFFIRAADLQDWQPHYEKASVRQAAGRVPDALAAAQPERFSPPSPRPGGYSTARSSPSNNLWVPPTPLLGRERELESVRWYLVSEGQRLITLTGPGGSGKTRLALEAAWQFVNAFEHGVWFVDLAPLTDATLIMSTIAQTLGLRAAGRRPVREVLTAWLCHRRSLLVLDNCEHLLAGTPEIAMLLGASPELRVLATSRAALHLAGEQVLPLQPLRVPDLAREYSAESVAQSAAVTLFVQRATAVDPTFQLTDANARAVAEICVHLDGLPLAIELAAARIRVLSAEQIATRLDDRFGLLTAGLRTALPRHRSLRATVDWSYDLLTEPERAFLRRLSVFAGGWTVDAAEVVAAGGSTEPHAVIDLLDQLVDKSLVIAEAQRGAVRYRLHETIRQYARERLQVAGEETRTRDRHLDHFLALAEEADETHRGAEYQRLLDRLEDEHANLRAALEWGLDPSRKDDAALRLSGALAWFWWLRGYMDEGRRWLERALDTEVGFPAARLKALYGDGILAHFQRDSLSARQRLEKSLAMARELGDRWAEAWVLHHLGRVAYYDDDPSTARSLGEQSLAVAEEVRDDWLIAWALHLLGLAAQIDADYPTARDYYTRSLSIRRELRHQEGIGILLNLLGVVAIREDDLGQAYTLLREGVAGSRDVQGPVGMAMPLAGFAFLAAALGQPFRAVRLGGTVTAICESYRSPLVPLFEELLREGLDRARRTLDAGVFDAAWAQGQAMSLEESIAEALAVEPRPPSMSSMPARHARKSGPFGGLTGAEIQVLRLLSRGLTTKEIATELFVSVSTVDRHLTHIYGKLGVRNRAEAIAFALQRGLT